MEETRQYSTVKMDCIFCQIVAGKVPSEILYQDEKVVAFRDINPQSPTHLVIIPKKHIPAAMLKTLPHEAAPWARCTPGR